MADDPNVDPITLRDTLIIWLFATANAERLKGIINKTISSDDLRKMLEEKKSIRIGKDDPNGDNAKTCDALCKVIQNANNIDSFTNIQDILTKMPTLTALWSGSPQHPRDVELTDTFIHLPG